jgi:hypothetical protein
MTIKRTIQAHSTHQIRGLVEIAWPDMVGYGTVFSEDLKVGDAVSADGWPNDLDALPHVAVIVDDCHALLG